MKQKKQSKKPREIVRAWIWKWSSGSLDLSSIRLNRSVIRELTSILKEEKRGSIVRVEIREV